MEHEKLRAVAIEAVAQYMGVAAEFVVDDAFDAFHKSTTPIIRGNMQQTLFLACLGNQLPREVPYDKVKQSIVLAMAK